MIREIKEIVSNTGDLIFRTDGRIEWICEHNVGHTVFSTKDDYIHGCDGCCADLPERIKDKVKKIEKKYNE